MNSTLYTCPMHPEVQKTRPESCPICGMDLEQIIRDTQIHDLQDYNDGMVLRFKIAVLFSLPLFILNMGMHFLSLKAFHHFIQSSYFNWVQFLFATPVVIGCGWPLLERGWSSLRTRNLNMFTLIGLGVGVSYFYSVFVIVMPIDTLTYFEIPLDIYFEPAAMITTFILLGQVMEQKARSKTSLAVKKLLDLEPRTAWLIDNDVDKEIAVSDIRVGNFLRIRPGDRIPVDGIVEGGNSSVDQSMITGEAIPVEKKVDSFVIGGTLNGTGSFIMRATKIGHETLLSQIIDMVAKAQRTKAPIQKLADTVSSYFVPAVIVIAILTLLGWIFIGQDPRIGILTSIAVLIIACPCALGLATPMSIMVSTGKGAKGGILIKNAEALETLAKINILVLDKTGTITEGKPSVVDVICISEKYSKLELLTIAASLERGSEHPLAEAIVRAVESQTLYECKDFKSSTGQGVTGKILDLSVALGNKKFMESLDIELIFQEEKVNHSLGHMYIAINNKFAGLILVEDKLKSDAQPVISAFQNHGIKVIMLTGDNVQTAQAIAKQVGIEEVQAEVLPQNKFDHIKALQNKGFIVAMVGDGINDAPALTQANVGIAIGNGTDVAVESAGIVLVSGNLTGLMSAKQLSELTLANIKQNLFLAFFYNILAIPLAAGVLYPLFGLLLNPIVASAAMTLSSLSVIFNALRLARIRI